MVKPTLEFNYDISCPFAYIASTRVEALASRAGATLVWRPVLLGAIYRATAAPQGASGSASDVFNPTKKAVAAASMQRTLRRYKIRYNPPPQHPRKTVNALRLLYAVEGEERRVLTKKLFEAYWVEGRDVSDGVELLKIVRESGIKSATGISEKTFGDASARRELEKATADAIERGAFGVPGFWIPEESWVDVSGEKRKGRFYWGQDRMHFVEATLSALRSGGPWEHVNILKSLMPRCIPDHKISNKVRVEFWYDFSSPWAFLGWTQLERLKRTFGANLEIVMKPFLLGILFREIGAPNLPSSAISPTKAVWARQDHGDWVRFWNAINAQEGKPDKNIDFHWAEIFPIRTPTVLRCAIVDPQTVPVLYRACWESNANVADDSVLVEVLTKGGFDGAGLLKKANAPDIKQKLRDSTAEAKNLGICGVPTYRVFRQNLNREWEHVGGLVWGQDESNVVEDLIAGWSGEGTAALAEPRKTTVSDKITGSRL
ncbi:thioredoxin-like protein [Paraphaeosphaeria sporulosa]|uniref:Thioredoxin-like protein n=1 Tax=Paraphaeosphaeria sporulosa TaxID=1460663 RepID=A0A177CWT6_9PLEO|nr:thioredoxin-like protein [Paraphaeosphaeria sporulosa]OAG11287.1 thioredoxin-like protein [Paraphaeosphaeria sporulosa]